MAFGNSHTFSPSFTALTLSLFLCLHFSFDHVSCDDVRRTYMIHVHRPPPEHTGSHRDWHEAFLPLPRISSDGGLTDSRLVYSYTQVMSGFAARLTEEELEATRQMDGFIHAEPDQQLQAHTTHTPRFLGLNPSPDSFWGSVAGYGRGVIIGVVDTGIDPTHPSFSNDRGMPPPPPRWKGKCEFRNQSHCNNKLIGARIFDHLNMSRDPQPFDSDEHGTHTAGTAAGVFVTDASLLGSARGTAAGVAPGAWVAMYKVGDGSFSNADITAAIDSAVEDGVDVLSLSLSGRAGPLYNTSVGVASFGAVRKGVFVSSSAGNDGPDVASVRNTAPWMLTVGASTVDRRVRSVVVLGNGEELEGQSAYQPTNYTSSFLPLIYPAQTMADPSGHLCSNLTYLLSINVRGKLVLCDRAGDDSLEKADNDEKGRVVRAAGGAGMILMNSNTQGFETRADAHFIPASHVSNFDRSRILSYRTSAPNPTARIIFKGTAIGSGASLSAPAVATFSSRGPSIPNPGILKPDIIGPGVDVLAAAIKPVGPFPVTPLFNMLSGTSMSCPHLSGVAALLRSIYPDWSPAMIKSAMMTTADLRNLKGGPIVDLLDNKQADFFATGAGHVNPLRASNPGLVYDIKIDDYIAYLCGLGYSDDHVSVITMERTRCSSYRAIVEADLNYPSLTVKLNTPSVSTNSPLTARVIRTVTNVGEPFSSYTVRIVRPSGVLVSVEPQTLYFTEVGQQQSFTVMFELSRTEPPPSWFSEGLLTWVSSEGRIMVNSPISVLFGNPSAA